MIKKLLSRQKNFSRLGKIRIAIGLAVLLLPVVLITSKAQTSGIIYRPSKLTSDSNITLSVSIQALDYSNGKWNYKVTWSRTLEKAGSIYLSPKVDRTATLSMTCASGGTNAQTGAADQIINSGGTIGRTGQCTGAFNPATRYRLEFYSEPAAGGKLLLRKFFNTLDQDGNPVSTEQIPATRGGTYTGTSSTGGSLGGVGTSGASGTSGTSATSGTSGGGSASVITVDNSFRGYLLTNKTYRVKWDATKKAADGSTPQTVNVYLVRSDCLDSTCVFGGYPADYNSADVNKARAITYPISGADAIMDQIPKDIHASRALYPITNVPTLDISTDGINIMTDPATGKPKTSGQVNGIAGLGINYFIPVKKGITKMVENVPFSQGYADFYLPDPANVSYSGKQSGNFPDWGPLDLIVLDSQERALESFNTAAAAFAEGRRQGIPLSSYMLSSLWTKKFISGVPLEVGVLSDLSSKALLMQMRDNSNDPTGLQNTPEPLLVINPGHESGQFDNEAKTESWQYTSYASKEIWAYATVGRPFVSQVFFYDQDRAKIQNCTDPKLIKIDRAIQLPPGLSYNQKCQKVTGGTVDGEITGTPSTPGVYLAEFKTQVRVGDAVVEGKTRIRFIVVKTNNFSSTVQVGNNYQPNGTAVSGSNPVLGGRSQIFWNQNGLTQGVVAWKDMDIWVAPGSQAGIHPDKVTTKYLVATVSDDVQICNSSTSTSGGNDTLGWGCSRYNWLVGNTNGPNLTSGDYTIFVTPHLPVVDRNRSAIGLLYLNGAAPTPNPSNGQLIPSADGFGYGYGAKVIHIDPTPSGQSGLSTVNAGGFGDTSFLKGGIEYVVKNSSGVVKTQGKVQYGSGAPNETGGTVSGQTINIDPGDSVELKWSAVDAQGRPYGTSWDSELKVTNGFTSYENAPSAALRQRTSVLVPGGFDWRSSAGFMNSSSGQFTVTSQMTQSMQGLGFSTLYKTNFYGCGNLTGGTNYDASSDPNLLLTQGATNCQLAVWMGTVLYINIGTSNLGHEAPLGSVNNSGFTTSPGDFNTDTCRLPDQNNMAAVVNPSTSNYALSSGLNEGSGYDSYTAVFNDIRKYNDAAGKPYKYTTAMFMVGTTREAVVSGCSTAPGAAGTTASGAPGSCVTGTVRGISDSNTGPNRFDAQFVENLQPNTNYYNRIEYRCAGVSGSRDIIWQSTTSGSGTF